MLEVTLGYRAERHHHAVTAMAWVPAATSTSTDASPVVGDSNTLPPSSPNHVLFTASRDSTLRSWTVAAPLLSSPPRARSALHGHSGWVTDLVYLGAQHHRIASCSLDKRVKLWTPDDGRCIVTAFGHDDYIQALAYSAHTDSLFSAGCDKAVMQWNLASQMDRPLRNMTGASPHATCGSFYALACNAAGGLLVGGGTDQIVRMWDPRLSASSSSSSSFYSSSLAAVIELPQLHTDTIRALAFRDDPQQILSAGADGKLIAWDLRMRRACDFFSPLADALASASSSSSSALSLSTSSADEFEAPSATDGSIVSIALSADGRRVVCAVQRSSLRFDRSLSSSRAAAHAPPAADTAYTSTVGGVTSAPSLSPSRLASTSALHVSSVRWHPTAPLPATGAICCVELDSRRSTISAECSAAPVRVVWGPDGEDSCIYSTIDSSLHCCTPGAEPSPMSSLPNSSSSAFSISNSSTISTSSLPASSSASSSVPSSSHVWCHGAPPLRKATLLHDGRSALCLDAAGAACVWDLLAAPPRVTERFSLANVLAEADADADAVETKPGTKGDSSAADQTAQIALNGSSGSTGSANVRADACQDAPADTVSVLAGFDALLARLQRRVPQCGRGLFVPPWCSLDLRLGALLVQIDPTAASFGAEAFAEKVMSADELRTTIGANDRVVAAYAPSSASAALTTDAAIPSAARVTNGNWEEKEGNGITDDDDDKAFRRRRRTRVALVDVFLRHVLADFIAYRHGTRRWAAERQRRLAKAAATIEQEARMIVPIAAAASSAVTDADQEQSLDRPASAHDDDTGVTASPAPDAAAASPLAVNAAAAVSGSMLSAALDDGVNPHDKISTFGIPLILHLAPLYQDSGKSRGGGSSSSTSSAAFIVSAGGGGGGPAVGSCSESQRWRCYALGQRPLSFYDRVLPVWVMSSLTALSSIAAAPSQRPPVKFDLFSGDPQLPELPKGSRLSCAGITSIRAVAEFVVHRIEVGGDLGLGGDDIGATSVDAHAQADSNPRAAAASAPTAPPEEAVDILLDTTAPRTAVGGPHAATGEHGMVLSFDSDLQSVRQFLYGARPSGDQSVMVLRYRRRQKKSTESL